jgi:hypothetical protein
MKHRISLALCSILIASFARAADRPNIVFIFSDDHALRTIGV